jgi:hypothetical protein
LPDGARPLLMLLIDALWIFPGAIVVTFDLMTER